MRGLLEMSQLECGGEVYHWFVLRRGCMLGGGL